MGDTLGCGVEPIHVTITEPQELIVSSVFSDVSCFGLNDGSAMSSGISGGVTLSSGSGAIAGGNVRLLAGVSTSSRGGDVEIVSGENSETSTVTTDRDGLGDVSVTVQ